VESKIQKMDAVSYS